MGWWCASCLALLAARAGANGEWVAVCAQYQWAGQCDDAMKAALNGFAEQKQPITCVAFAPSGDWVILAGDNQVATSNGSLPAVKKLVSLKAGHKLKSVTFDPDGYATVLWDSHFYWSDNPSPAAIDRLQRAVKSAGEPLWAAYAPGGGYLLRPATAAMIHDGVPIELSKALAQAAAARDAVRCVSFSSSGRWFLLTDSGASSSDPTTPVAKGVAQLVKDGKSPTWLAVGPGFGEHDFARWARVVKEECDGKISGGYAYKVFFHGQEVLAGVNGWARAPWEKEHPSVKFTFDTILGVASVSKTITAVALVKLRDELKGTAKAFSLDDPFWPFVAKVCPEASDSVKKVTLRQLLTHTSGFPKLKDLSTPEQLETLLVMPLVHPPGTMYAYHNNNFYTLRLVIEGISGAPYAAYVKDHVLRPVGIADMETHHDLPIPACGYGALGDNKPGFPFPWNCDTSAGAAGWYGSVNDLGRLVLGLRDHALLDEPACQEMYSGRLGFDPGFPGAVKDGYWEGGGGGMNGEVGSGLCHFPDDVDAVMLRNCKQLLQPPDILVKAWQNSMP
jgi:CubicO group peptidase (beta-lactamase class C family)